MSGRRTILGLSGLVIFAAGVFVGMGLREGQLTPGSRLRAPPADLSEAGEGPSALRALVPDASRDAQEALAQASALLKTADGVIAKDSPLHHRITRALKEVSEAAQAVREIADLLQRHPEALIQGKQ